MRQGVAISTTGDEHRMGFLETAVQHWDRALGPGDCMFITVDGDEDATARVVAAVSDWTLSVFRVGQRRVGVAPYNGRLGVAANKNTGLELLMGVVGNPVEHLFLCDDDTYPFAARALRKHTDLGIPHSMVCWGGHRMASERERYATWTWPRGVMLYAHRAVVERVGGMIEEFGPGGHEHAEWSRRIHQSGMTPAPYITPRYMAEHGVVGPATRAGTWWHCEDMRQPDETSAQLGHRRKRITSVRKDDRDWAAIHQIMDNMDGDTSFVPFSAHENGRASATLCATSTGLGAGGDL
jgi:hypothetical protein